MREVRVTVRESRAALHDAIAQECDRHHGGTDHAAAVSFVAEQLLGPGGTRASVDALVVVSAHDDATMLMVRYRSAAGRELEAPRRAVLDRYCSRWSSVTSNGSRTIHAQVLRADVRPLCGSDRVAVRGETATTEGVHSNGAGTRGCRDQVDGVTPRVPAFGALAAVLTAALAGWVCLVWLLHLPGDGTLPVAILLSCLATVMGVRHHRMHRVVADANRVTDDLRVANAHLMRVALHDHLTGLHSRAAFSETLDQAVAQAQRAGEHIALLFFDIDRFKAINDALGHAAGDTVLREIADRLPHLLRSGDSCARFGGDEFALLLRGLDAPHDAHRVAERLRSIAHEPIIVRGHDIHPTLSIGVATTLRHHDDAETLLRDADTAQYRAKQAGGDNIVVFDAELRAELQEDIAEEAALRAALDAGELVAHFQPQIDLLTGKPVAAEALARWHHPHRGVLAARDFIHVARRARILESVDRIVTAQAIDARLALEELGAPSSFRIWINIVDSRITTDGPGQLQALLADAGLRPDQLGIEITERQVQRDLDTAARHLSVARDAGIKIALGAFGAAQSSLTLIRHLPIDVIKIDRSFITDLTSNDADRAIVSAIVHLAQNLGIRVVAEAVETEAQRDLLLELGCNHAQGHLFAPALPFGQLAETIRTPCPTHADTTRRAQHHRASLAPVPDPYNRRLPSPAPAHRSGTPPTLRLSPPRPRVCGGEEPKP